MVRQYPVIRKQHIPPPRNPKLFKRGQAVCNRSPLPRCTPVPAVEINLELDGGTDLEGMGTAWIGDRIYQPTLDEVLLGTYMGETPNTYYAKKMYYPIGRYPSPVPSASKTP